MLQPKRTKFRKAFKGRIHGIATSGATLAFGQFGLKALEPERVTARQTVKNTGNAITQGTVRFAIYSPSGRLVKSWSKKTSLIRPKQKFTYSFSYPHRLGAGTYRVVAAFDYGYPITTRRASTRAQISRGHSAVTH